MRFFRFFLSAAAVLAVLAAFPRGALAQETHLGAITITRQAEIKGLYDNNIFLTSSTTYASGIAQFSHDIGFAVDQKRTKAFAGYHIDLIQYDKFPGVNNAVNQEATAKLSHEPGKGSTLGASDDFKATNVPASSELVERVRRNENDAVITGETGLGPDLFVGADAGHTLHHYLVKSQIGRASCRERV